MDIALQLMLFGTIMMSAASGWLVSSAQKSPYLGVAVFFGLIIISMPLLLIAKQLTIMAQATTG